jgi:hypothetical protein
MSNDFIETLEQEETDLALHTKLCAQRYQQITDRFDRMDTRLQQMEVTLVEIKNAIVTDTKDNYKLYLTWAGVIITSLIGATGFLLAHYVFK